MHEVVRREIDFVCVLPRNDTRNGINEYRQTTGAAVQDMSIGRVIVLLIVADHRSWMRVCWISKAVAPDMAEEDRCALYFA